MLETGKRCHLQMEKWDGKVLDINHTVQTPSEKCSSILAIHAFSGCDTASYPAGKGKVSALRALHATPSEVLHYVGEENVTYTQITEAVKAFFLALYNQNQSSSLNVASCYLFNKRKTPPALKMLPPTECNAHLHGRRAHLQVLLWKAADHPNAPIVDITKFGWDIQKGPKEGMM